METPAVEPSDIRTSKIDTALFAEEPCFICGRELFGKKHYWVHTKHGAYVYVAEPTCEEQASADYSGLVPIGSKCAKDCRAIGISVLTDREFQQLMQGD
jgi:hypothetical protein